MLADLRNHRIQFEYAKNLTKDYSKSFYLTARMLPKQQKWATYALYSFCRYVDNLADVPRPRLPQEIRAEMNYISKELKIAYRTGESEHPIISAYILVAKKYNIPLEYPLELLKGVAMDVEIRRYCTFKDLYLFCYRVAGIVGLMMTHVLGYRKKEAFFYAEKLGIAMQLTNILRDIKEDKELDRIYIPIEELRRFGLSEHDFLHEDFTPQMAELMKFQVHRALCYYDLAYPGIKMLEPKVQFAIYSAAKIYRGILTKIQEGDYNPFLGRVYIPFGKKIQILLHEVFRSKLLTVTELLLPVCLGAC
jgi:phytoene synthase